MNPNPRLSPALMACQAIADVTNCTPTLALDLGIKVAARRLTLSRAITAARFGTPDRPHQPLIAPRSPKTTV